MTPMATTNVRIPDGATWVRLTRNLRPLLSRKDADAIREGNRTARPGPLTAIEGLEDSIRILSEDGWSTTDISCFFGVVGERIRQVAGKADIELRRSSDPRVWCERQNRFVAVPKEVCEAHADAEAQARRERRRARSQRIRQAEYVRKLQALAEKLGRPPGTAEFLSHLDQAYSSVAYWFGCKEEDTSYLDAMNRLYDAAGIERE